MDGTETRELPVKLIAEELAQIAKALAERVVAREAVQAEKDAADEGWRAVLKGHDTEIERLAKLYGDGTEDRKVECRREYDIPGGYVMRVWRVDTGETIHERPMTDEEREKVRQGDLFPPAGSDVAPPPSKEEAANALVEVAKRAGDQPNNGNVTTMTPKNRKDVH